ncbi:hypothetical protein E3N88_32610 [Mikania micrantha]|uniref:SWIM-type domain-containing protein n=1 Tax=Mikania micrantha TaxID=192012 RepID=A0A5N6M914_9ASTR|nr:hypothetical protein E3N88_32610 [Mikania micrantha]
MTVITTTLLNTSGKKCTCRKWQTQIFPCSHVVVVCRHRDGLPHEIVDARFHTFTYRQQHGGHYYPLRHKALENPRRPIKSYHTMWKEMYYVSYYVYEPLGINSHCLESQLFGLSVLAMPNDDPHVQVPSLVKLYPVYIEIDFAFQDYHQ